MYKVLILSIFMLFTLFSSGCVYRSGIIQGGQIEERAIKRVEIGMDRDQVRRLLGTPMVQDTYHPDRWDYVYYSLNMVSSKTPERITIFFENGRVAKIENNKPPSSS